MIQTKPQLGDNGHFVDFRMLCKTEIMSEDEVKLEAMDDDDDATDEIGQGENQLELSTKRDIDLNEDEIDEEEDHSMAFQPLSITPLMIGLSEETSASEKSAPFHDNNPDGRQVSCNEPLTSPGTCQSSTAVSTSIESMTP